MVALAAAACLLFFFGGNLVLRIEADYATATAEQRRVQLADGTTVLLGPESAYSSRPLGCGVKLDCWRIG